MATMTYSFIVTYFLMFLFIQDSVADYLSIHANPTSVRAGEAYNVSCQSNYNTVWLRKNNTYIAGNRANGNQCQFGKNATKEDYKCSAKGFVPGHVGLVKLTVLQAENYSTEIPWSCYVYYDGNTYKKYLNITIRKDDRNKDLPPKSNTEEASSSSDDTNTMLISIVSAVGVMIMFITMIVGVYVCNKRKADQAKQAPTRQLAPETGGFQGDCQNIQSPSPLSYDWSIGDEDFGTYDVAHPVAHPDDLQQSTNSNFDPSLLYGVVSKPGPWTAPEPEFNSNIFSGDPEPSNPNFDPDKVYGSVIRS